MEALINPFLSGSVNKSFIFWQRQQGPCVIRWASHL